MNEQDFRIVLLDSKVDEKGVRAMSFPHFAQALAVLDWLNLNGIGAKAITLEEYRGMPRNLNHDTISQDDPQRTDQPEQTPD